MSKHTPGPWQAEADPYEDGTPYFKFKAGSGFVDEGEGGFSFTAIISEADAKLIVAAPQMLDLLSLVSSIVRLNDDDLADQIEELIKAAGGTA